MIFEVQNYKFIFWDIVYSIPVGFVLGFINRLLSVFLYRGKIRLFIKDVLNGINFAGLLFSYSVSFANYGVLRWYNLAGAILGFWLFGKGFTALCHTCAGLFGATLKFFTLDFLKRICGKIRKMRTKFFAKQKNRRKTAQNNKNSHLPKEDKVLYN